VTFAVAAVLQAEPARSNRPLLVRTLKALFAAAGESSGDGSVSSRKLWRSRVHALNCLRLLFNSSTLGAQMLQWVEQGLLCAFSGFRCAVLLSRAGCTVIDCVFLRSSSWSVRNSSTLLFSCLVSRALGGSSNRNTVSLADFCSQFQGLPFALADLLAATMTEFEDVGHSTSLQPVLVLLASLRPSPDLPPRLSHCITSLRQHVDRVTRCSDVLLSRMAASALATLQPTASAAAAWVSYVTHACNAIAQRHSLAVTRTSTLAPSPSRHVTLGHICTATAILDAHATSSTLADSWWSILPPSATLSSALLHALAVASPSEAERLCLMLQSLSKFVDTAAAASSASSPSSAAAEAAAETSAFLSAAAHVITERCCTPQPSALVSHSIAACVFSGRAISFCLKRACLSDVRLILAGRSDSGGQGHWPSLMKSEDSAVRRAVLKHCFESSGGARATVPSLELLELLVEHLPNESAPPLQRKCLKRLAEILQSVVRELGAPQQRHLPAQVADSNFARLRVAVAEVMRFVCAFISNAVKHSAPASTSEAQPATLAANAQSSPTLSEKSIQAAVGAAAAAASAATTACSPAADIEFIFQNLFHVVTGSIVLSDHPDVAEACAAAVASSGVMRHDVWAAKFSSCLLGLIQVCCPLQYLEKNSVCCAADKFLTFDAVRRSRRVCQCCQCHSCWTHAFSFRSSCEACPGVLQSHNVIGLLLCVTASRSECTRSSCAPVLKLMP
jgi:hypothetical protein